MRVLIFSTNFVCTHFSFQEEMSEIWSVFTYSKVKWSRYRPGVAQRVGRGIALLFHDRSTRRGWVVSSTPRPHFTPGKDLVPILQEAGWAPGPVWTGGNSRPHRDSIPHRPARSQSLCRLSYRAHLHVKYPLLLSDLNEIWIFSTDFSKKYSNTKFHENPSSGRRRVPCGQADRQKNMTKLIFAFRILQTLLNVKEY